MAEAARGRGPGPQAAGPRAGKERGARERAGRGTGAADAAWRGGGGGHAARPPRPPPPERGRRRRARRGPSGGLTHLRGGARPGQPGTLRRAGERGRGAGAEGPLGGCTRRPPWRGHGRDSSAELGPNSRPLGSPPERARRWVGRGAPPPQAPHAPRCLRRQLPHQTAISGAGGRSAPRLPSLLRGRGGGCRRTTARRRFRPRRRPRAGLAGEAGQGWRLGP